ncbi:trans-sialidase, putative [Trypanosoma cruzi marinkellei]|uniref:Trans-sialidase, putative n=1 Tax=Trypanosoma cruzi marinkellei TaxID=85056 RepID=K2MVE5_TRYCR|nr:trans-sialidase, putative [Trypanosoma cruzi marinkellei]
MSSCGEGQHQLYMSDGHGTSWCPNCVPINCVWCNSHDREGYGVPSGSSTAVIGDERVMLAILPAYSKDNERGRLHLWVTSSVRVHGVGPIPREGDEAATSFLLVKGNNDGLISLYESKRRSEGGSHGRVAFARGGGAGAGKRGGEEMDSFGQRLAIMRLYCQGWLGAAAKGMRTGPVPTKGLVAFLSGSSTGTEWRDEYLGVCAIIKNAAAAVNGVTLEGAGAGAQWPVDTQGPTVPH